MVRKGVVSIPTKIIKSSIWLRMKNNNLASFALDKLMYDDIGLVDPILSQTIFFCMYTGFIMLCRFIGNRNVFDYKLLYPILMILINAIAMAYVYSLFFNKKFKYEGYFNIGMYQNNYLWPSLLICSVLCSIAKSRTFDHILTWAIPIGFSSLATFFIKKQFQDMGYLSEKTHLIFYLIAWLDSIIFSSLLLHFFTYSNIFRRS